MAVPERFAEYPEVVPQGMPQDVNAGHDWSP